MPTTRTAVVPLRPAHGVRRRTLLQGACAAAVVRCATASAAAPALLSSVAPDRRFSVFYKGARIGHHTVLHSPATGDTRVDTEIHMRVKVAFFTAFAFEHRSGEAWRDGRLVALESETVEHGETLHVRGAVTPEGFRVTGPGGPCIASTATLTSNSLWTPRVLQQATLVDAQHGGLIGVSARRFADEQIVVGGRAVAVTRYTFITPFLAGSIWYDAASLWVRGEFERDGAKIHYQLDA